MRKWEDAKEGRCAEWGLISPERAPVRSPGDAGGLCCPAATIH